MKKEALLEELDLTPTQRRMLKVLADGLPHSREELHACLDDELGPVSNIKAHLTYLRRKLRPRGEDIFCVRTFGGMHYRYVRIISSS